MYQFFLVLLNLLIFLAAFPASAKNIENIKYHMSFAISESDIDDGIPVEVQAHISLPEARQELCFYLAYNDPVFFYDPNQDLTRSQALAELHRPKQGQIIVKDSSQSTAADINAPSYLYRKELAANQRHITLDFQFVVPRWPDRIGNQFLFHQFYPQLLESCPDETVPSYNWQKARNVIYQAALSWPANWQLSTAHHFVEPKVIQAENKLVFNLSKNYRISYFQVKDITIQMVYLSDTFPAYERYIRNFLVSLISSIGDFPSDKLLMIETEDLERSRIPGVITLNRPKQTAMQSLQQGYLNWIAWQLAFLLAEQWYGTSIGPLDFDDYWFFRGTAEFVASIAIHQEPSIRNLFASDDQGDPFLRLTYHQGADLAASIMRLYDPNLRLLDDDGLKSRESYFNQHSFAYIRHVLAMRYLHWLFGENFLKAIRAFYLENAGQRVTHIDFLNFLENFSGLAWEGYYAHEILKQWWQTNSWPDYSLRKIKVRSDAANDNRKQAYVEFRQAEELRLPVDIVLTTSRGRRIREMVFSQQRINAVTFDLMEDEEPDIVEINPGREVYDRDRFDNSNRGPRIKFFPGNADTLRDDAYTIVWAPFPSLLPGESLTLNLGLQAFRYVSAGVSGIVSYNPQEGRLGYNIKYLAEVPRLDSQLLVDLIQDYGQTFKGERIASLALSHVPEFLRDPELTLTVSSSFRETIGDEESRHLVGGLQAALKSKRYDRCQYQLLAARHQTFASLSDFNYTRQWGLAQFSCAGKGLELKLRSFVGNLRGEGRLSYGILFNPQSLEEARIRIDQPSMPSAQDIHSLGIDFSWPAHLPLPAKFFVLPRQSRWRISYDYGESHRPDMIYSNAGFGFTLPIGGDVVGKSSLSVLNFTVMGIFYRRYADKVSYQPGVIFDFLGNL